MSIAVEVGMDNRYAIDNMAMLKECNIHIISSEYQQQKTNKYLLTSSQHEQRLYFPFTKIRLYF
jgi:hypothetical protein